MLRSELSPGAQMPRAVVPSMNPLRDPQIVAAWFLFGFMNGEQPSSLHLPDTDRVLACGLLAECARSFCRVLRERALCSFSVLCGDA